MAKSLNDILQRYKDVISGKLPPSKIEKLTTGDNPGVDYADKMKDGRYFVAMHTVEKHPDRNGNGDDVFKGSTTKAKMERHGHEPKPKDVQVYNKTQQQNEEYELDETSGAKAERYKKAARSGLLHLAVHTKDGPDKTRKIVNRATGMERADRAIDKDIAKRSAAQKKRLGEAKDEREYGYEGDMAITQLKTICRNAEHLMKMMKPDTDLPEWVQSKITKAEDYITTAHDYLMSEMNEEVEELDESDFEKKLTKKQRARLNAAVFKASPQNPVNIEKKKRQAEKEKTDWYNSFKKPTNEEVEITEKEIVKKVKGLWKKVSDAHDKKMKENDDFRRKELGPKLYKKFHKEAKLCETCGKSPCQCDTNDKSKKPKKLLLEPQVNEMATSQNQAIAARIALKHKREGTMPPKGTASHSMMGMSEKQLHDYTKAEKGAPKKVEESVSDQRSAKATASEKAREKIANALERKKLEKMKHKMKMEQSAPAETVIRMPSGDVGDTGRV